MRTTPAARSDSGVVAGLAQLRGYTPAWFRADLLAGITVTAYLVPQCLAYADLAGLYPRSWASPATTPESDRAAGVVRMRSSYPPRRTGCPAVSGR